jgi:phage shock protein A
MQARAGAIDELIASGALDDSSQLSAGDDISRELQAMSSQSDVETELAALKSRSTQALPAADAPAPPVEQPQAEQAPHEEGQQ